MSKPKETLSKDYAATAENLSTILKKELTYYACKGYLNSSDPTMITAADRMIVADWCYGVVDHYQLSRETVANAMEMVDRFLSVSAGPSALWDINSDVAKAGDNALHCHRQFQLLTVAALYSCLKAKDAMFSSDQFAEACGIYTKEEIDAMEHTLLRGLSWRSNTPTAHQVGHATLSLLVPHVNLPEATWGFLLDEMKYQTEMAVRDYYFSTQRPSTIALASIYNAIESISSKTDQEMRMMLNTFLLRIVGCFEYGESMHINAARRRLQQLLRGDNVFEEEPDTPKIPMSQTFKFDRSVPTPLDSGRRSPFSSDILGLDILHAVDVFMKTFPIDCEDEKKMMHCVPSSTAAIVSPDKIPSKPVRPMPAYHIFLQIEKEFIIQTMAGEDADKSIHDDKVYLHYVPERYRHIKLTPDWYHPAGKRRQKRKHRKQHGKIGFKEITHLISSRWAKLSETNPEVMKFVQDLSKRELAQYRREMAAYEKYFANASTSSTVSKCTEPKKRALEGEVECEETPCKPRKLLRRITRSDSLFSIDETAEAVVDEKDKFRPLYHRMISHDGSY